MKQFGNGLIWEFENDPMRCFRRMDYLKKLIAYLIAEKEPLLSPPLTMGGGLFLVKNIFT